MNNSIQFILELSNTCNFACTYCYLNQASSLKQQDVNYMALETGLRIMDFFIDECSKSHKKIYVDFLDGEPLLNFETLKAMVIKGRQYEKENDIELFVFRFTTNGSLLTPEIIAFTEEYGVYFNISIDGLPESHDVARVYKNGKGTSADVHTKLDLITNKEKMGIVSTYTPETYHLMYEGTKYFMDKGFKHIEVNFSSGEFDFENTEHVLSIFENVLELYLDDYRKKNFTRKFVMLDQVLKQLYNEQYIYKGCMNPFKINYKGEIYSCDRIPKHQNNKLATVNDRDIDFNKLAESHYCKGKTVDLCVQCDYQGLCKPCNVYVNDTYQNIHHNNPIYCQIMKKIIDKAKEFYSQHSRDLIIALIFSSDLRKKLVAREFEIV